MIAERIKVCNLGSEPALSNTKVLLPLIAQFLAHSFNSSQVWPDSRVSQVPGALLGSSPEAMRIPDPGSALKAAEATGPGAGDPGVWGRRSVGPRVSVRLPAAAAGEEGRDQWGPRNISLEAPQRHFFLTHSEAVTSS